MWTCLVYPTVGHSASFSSLCCFLCSLKWHQIYSEDRSWSPGRNSDTTGADGMRLEGELAKPAAIKVRGEPCCFQRSSGELSESQEKLNQEGLVRSLFLFRYMWNDRVTLWEVPKESDRSAWGRICLGRAPRWGLRAGARTEWRQRGIWVPTSGADGGLTQGKGAPPRGMSASAGNGDPARSLPSQGETIQRIPPCQISIYKINLHLSSINMDWQLSTSRHVKKTHGKWKTKILRNTHRLTGS